MKRIFAFIILITAASVLYADTQSRVVIFTKPGCGRCEFMISYLKDNNLDYTEYSTSDAGNNKKMWEVVRASDQFKGGSITMPVVVFNGKTFINIKNLNEFAASLSSNTSSNKSDIEKTDTEEAIDLTLPESITVWTNGNEVVNQKVKGWMKKNLPIINHYKGTNNGVYIAVYSHNKFKSIYPVSETIYVMGLIRVKGTWDGTIAIPEGWEGKDISASDEFKKMANKYFPACKNGGWAGGDTGGFFNR